jgi:hypothetical protein
MALRWVRCGLFTELRDAAGALRGQVVRSFLDRKNWLGWADPRVVDSFPTRAAAMRAVAGRADPKKGYGLG